MISYDNVPYLPTTRQEMEAFGWDELDVLLLTGDAYVDHPSFGVSLIGRILLAAGFRTGVIAQFPWQDPEVLKVMGTPRVGIGISSGNLDSMVNIYTAGRRKRREDAYIENGETGQRPPHALVVYSQLAKRAFPGVPVVLGGLEASMRRATHYDYWQDKLRFPVLVDTKADILIYGMGERPILEIFNRLRDGKDLAGIPGTARLLGKKAAESFVKPENFLEMPSHEEHLQRKSALMDSTKLVELASNQYANRGLIEKVGDRLLVIEPPQAPLTSEELDRVNELNFSRKPHPKYKNRIPAFETIRDSIPAVRGCPGGCAFCGLVAHQGRGVTSRSEKSILHDIEKLTADKNFRGTISDIGGAAGNIYGSLVKDQSKCQQCRRSSCLWPLPCPNYVCDGKRLLALLREIRKNPKVKHLYINSGMRLDLANQQKELFREIIRNHVSGHMKVAPEHLNDEVLKLMRKNPSKDFYVFKKFFEDESRAAGKEQYLIPLFISNFPGCTEKEMKTVDDFLNLHNWSPQQVQDYIPLPMTMGGAMYYTGLAPDGKPIEVNRGLAERRTQINMLKKKRHGGHIQDKFPQNHKKSGNFNRPGNKKRPAGK